MENKWSKFWNSSSQPRKQRKYAFNAPLHIRHKFMSASLSKELRKEYGVRSVPVRVGDSVKVMAGQFKGKTGKVTKVSLATLKVHVEGASVTRTDGTEALYPIHPSNLQIAKLDMSDKRRVEKLERLKKENGKQ